MARGMSPAEQERFTERCAAVSRYLANAFPGHVVDPPLDVHIRSTWVFLVCEVRIGSSGRPHFRLEVPHDRLVDANSRPIEDDLEGQEIVAKMKESGMREPVVRLDYKWWQAH
jgi:hypothetical protein